MKLSANDMALLSQQIAAQLLTQFRQSSPEVLRPHAYTIEQVSVQIGYCPATVRQFITKGRKDSRGTIHKLNAKEITPKDYRILPADLDQFLAYF